MLPTGITVDHDLVFGIRTAFQSNFGLHYKRFTALEEPRLIQTIDERVLGSRTIGYAVLRALMVHVPHFSHRCWESVWGEISRPHSITALAQIYRVGLPLADLGADAQKYHCVLGAEFLAYVGQAALLDLESTVRELRLVFDGLLGSAFRVSPRSKINDNTAWNGFEVDLVARMKKMIGTKTDVKMGARTSAALLKELDQVRAKLRRSPFFVTLTDDFYSIIFFFQGGFGNLRIYNALDDRVRYSHSRQTLPPRQPCKAYI